MVTEDNCTGVPTAIAANRPDGHIYIADSNSSLLWWHAPEQNAGSLSARSAPLLRTGPQVHPQASQALCDQSPPRLDSSLNNSIASSVQAVQYQSSLPPSNDLADIRRCLNGVAQNVGELVLAQKGSPSVAVLHERLERVEASAPIDGHAPAEVSAQGLAELLRHDIARLDKREPGKIFDADSTSKLVDVLRQEVRTLGGSLRCDIASEMQRATDNIIQSVLQVTSSTSSAAPSTSMQDVQLGQSQAEARRALEEVGEVRVELQRQRAGAQRWRQEAETARIDLEAMQTETARACASAAAAGQAQAKHDAMKAQWREEADAARAEMQILRQELRSGALENSAAASSAEQRAAHAKAEVVQLVGSLHELQERLECAEGAKKAAERKLIQQRQQISEAALDATRNSSCHANAEAELHDKLEKSSARTAQLTALVEQLEKQLGDAHSALKEADRVVRDGRDARVEVSRVQAELAQSQGECARLCRQIEDMRQELSCVKALSSVRRSEIGKGDVMDELVAARSEHSDVGSELAKQVALVNSLQQQLDSARADFLSSMQAHSADKEQLRSVRAELQKRESDKASEEALQEAQEAANILRKELEVARGEARELRLQVKDVQSSKMLAAKGEEDESRKRKAANDQIRQLAEELEQVNKDFVLAKEDDSRKLKAAGVEIQNLTDQLEDVKDELAATKAIKKADEASKEDMLKEAQEAAGVLREELEVVRDEAHDLRLKLKQVQSARNSVNKDDEGESRKLRAATSEIRQLTEQLEQVKEELKLAKGSRKGSCHDEESKQEVEQIREEMEKLRASFKETRADARRLRRENEQLQEQLQA